MAKETPWKPADGAEQVNSAPAAQQARVGAAHFTPQHRSDERDRQSPAPDGPSVAGPEPFDPAYAAWRGANGNRLDADYRRWRAETGQPFSDAFLRWAEEEAGGRGG